MVIEHITDLDVHAMSRFQMAFVGHGPALEIFTGILAREDFASAFPRAKIVGRVPDPEAHDEPEPPVFEDIPVFASVEELFAQRPALDLVIDLSTDSRFMKHMRTLAPAETSLASAEGLVRFCAAAADGRIAVGGGSHLRKAEKLFALLVDQVEGDIFLLSPGGIILDVNRHAAKSRKTTRAKLIGRPCFDGESDERFCSQDPKDCPFQCAKVTGSTAEHTFTRTMQDGRVRYLEAQCFPIADSHGTPSSYLYVRRDVTEKRKLQQRLERAEKMAAIGALSAYMAHEIRNPLFAISGFANSLLRSPGLDDQTREKVRIIVEESRRLDGIMGRLTNFARPSEQSIEEFNAGAVIRESLALLEIERCKGVRVVTDIPHRMPKAHGNAENLRQCLTNVIKNSLEAMPEGGEISIIAQEANGFIRIIVNDTGTGITPEDQEKIFSPFYTTKKRDSGVGLAMTRKIIEEMGGQVMLASQPGKGTTVSLTIPAALALKASKPESAENEREES